MGNLHYFYKVDKNQVEEIKNLTCEQWQERYNNKADDEGYIYFHDSIDKTEIYNLGSLGWGEIEEEEEICSVGEPLFLDKDLQEEYSIYNPYIVGKNGIIKTIEVFRKKIMNMLKNLQEDGDYLGRNITSANKMSKYVTELITEWQMPYTVDTTDKNECVSHSARYEYAIFNLAYIVKTIDWEKDTILFCCW